METPDLMWPDDGAVPAPLAMKQVAAADLASPVPCGGTGLPATGPAVCNYMEAHAAPLPHIPCQPSPVYAPPDFLMNESSYEPASHYLEHDCSRHYLEVQGHNQHHFDLQAQEHASYFGQAVVPTVTDSWKNQEQMYSELPVEMQLQSPGYQAPSHPSHVQYGMPSLHMVNNQEMLSQSLPGPVPAPGQVPIPACPAPLYSAPSQVLPEPPRPPPRSPSSLKTLEESNRVLQLSVALDKNNSAMLQMQPSLLGQDEEQKLWLQTPGFVQQGHPEPLASVGSREHDLGTCKPCAFLHTKGCENGESCSFCHLCEPGEKKRRRKDKMDMQKALKKSGMTTHRDRMQRSSF